MVEAPAANLQLKPTKMTALQVFTVRNDAGQFLGRYRARTAQSAIQRLIDEQIVTASAFKRSQPAARLVNLSAKVES